MRIGSTLLRHTLALLLVLAGLAPAAGAQTLVPVTGQPISYRVSVPEGWEQEWDDDVLLVTSESEEVIITVTALDLVAVQNPPASARAEARRTITDRVMLNDSFHLALLERNVQRTSPHPVSDIVGEIGTLGGGKAGCVSARTTISGQNGWVRLCSTVHEGVLYQLMFQGTGTIQPEQEALVARIRDSFEPADVS